MSIRTVRLDEEAERALQEIQAATGMPISAALKRGLRVVRDEVVRTSRQTAYEIYCQLDLGAGGYASGPSIATRAVARKAIARKVRR
jgi:hypothetical protein